MAETRGGRGTSERKRIAVWIALGALLLVVLLALRPDRARRERERESEDARAAAAAPLPAAAPKGPGAAGPIDAAEWARIAALLPERPDPAAPDGGDAAGPAWDAFRPYPAASADEPAAEAPAAEPDRFRLEGVSLAAGSERRHAILNDRVVRVGDEVNGHRVVAIERGRIVLESGGRRTEISIRSEKSE